MVRPRPVHVWTLLLAGLALTLAACQDSQVTPVELSPDFHIFEARTGGNPDLFFYPPLANTPDASDPRFDAGASNGALRPTVRICVADTTLGTPAGCVEDVTLGATGSAAGLVMTYNADAELYQVNWQTRNLNTALAYRIEIWGLALTNRTQRPDSAGGVDSRWLFGWRDIANSPSTASCTTATKVCLTNFGQTIPIKVRIEQFAFCPVARNCAAQFVAAGTDANLEAMLPQGSGAPSSQLFLPGQQGTDFSLAFEPCSMQEEERVNAAIDLPTFGPCLKTVTTFTQALAQPAIISICETLDPSGFGLTLSQRELLALHHFTETGAPANQLRVEALPEAFRCGAPTSGGLARTNSNWLQQFAHGVREKVTSWVAPQSAQAAAVVIDRGGGGSSAFVGSFFKLALPGKFGRGSPDFQARPVGSPVMLTAKVTDLLGAPVRNARVRWEVFSSPNPPASITPTVPVLTNSSGEANVTVTLSTTQGDNVIHAFGKGIADDRTTNACTVNVPTPGTAAPCNGPRSGPPYGPFDPFQPFHYDTPTVPGFDGPSPPAGPFEQAIELPDGTRLPFTVFGCLPGRGMATVDGTMAAGEWACAYSRDFTANVSGGSGFPAKLFWMNDGANLYLAVRVTGTDRTNSLRFDFDNNGNAGPETVVSPAEENDDVLEFNPPSSFKDRYLTAKCTNSSQSSCGNDDPIQDGSGAFRNDQAGFTVYELSHPLSTGQAVDFSRSPNDPLLGLFVTLRLGNGAQGNTQWPGFRKYLKITIAAP